MSAADYTLLRLASVVEALTLLALLGVAVPLKHLFGVPQAVAIAGPAHGLAFLLFGWAAIRAAAADDWTARETAFTLIAACLPFGGFVNERRFALKQAAAG